jgi:hypothetical protein
VKNEQLAASKIFQRIPAKPETLSRGVHGSRSKKIPGSARYEHDTQRESKDGNPPSGHKKSESLSLALSTPRNNDFKANPSGTQALREISSWNCACI